MTGQCCKRGAIAGSVLPVAALVLLPKCPLCLAAWLTLATGVGISAVGAGWVRDVLVVVEIAGVVLAVAPITRRRIFRRG